MIELSLLKNIVKAWWFISCRLITISLMTWSKFIANWNSLETSLQITLRISGCSASWEKVSKWKRERSMLFIVALSLPGNPYAQHLSSTQTNLCPYLISFVMILYRISSTVFDFEYTLKIFPGLSKKLCRYIKLASNLILKLFIFRKVCNIVSKLNQD